jgi:malate dehydrogenase (oxaloacetate-decarboxylating)
VLRARARSFNDSMLLAAAEALAAAAAPGQLLPDPLDVSVHARVSQAVQAVINGATPTQDVSARHASGA